MAVTRRLLSASSNGSPIPVVQTATPGTLIHTGVAGTIGIDEVYLRASNVTAAGATITVEWGSVADPGGHTIKNYQIPPYSPQIPIINGDPINNGQVVRAFSDTASAINIMGFVNRIQ